MNKSELPLDLLARKGDAPATAVPEETPPAKQPKAMSVRLDVPLYERLDYARFKLKLTAQDMFVEAIDAWLLKKGF